MERGCYAIHNPLAIFNVIVNSLKQLRIMIQTIQSHDCNTWWNAQYSQVMENFVIPAPDSNGRADCVVNDVIDNS